MKRAALPKDLKRQNYEEILRSFAGKKDFTIAQITNDTRISRLTISKAIDYFLEKKVIVSSGKGSSTSIGGKKPMEYMLNPQRYIIGVSAAAKKTYFTLIRFNGEIVDQIVDHAALFITLDYERLIQVICENARLLLEKNHIAEEALYGIIICMGGIADRHSQMTFTANSPSWGKNRDVAGDIRRILGGNTFVYVENVAKVSAGTLLFDEKVRDKRVALFYADYGVSIILLEDGKIPITRHSIAGEMGHMCLDMNDEEVCGCGAKGCLEVLISEKRIRRSLEQLHEKEELLRHWDGQEDIRKYLLRQERQGNALARPFTDYMADIIGLALRNVYLGFDPDYTVFVGLFADASDTFLERIRRKIRENGYLLDESDLEMRRFEMSLPEVLNKGGLNIMLGTFLDTESEE